MRETRTPGVRTASRLSRLTAVLALGASVLLSTPGPGRAAEDPLPDIPDYQAALDAVKSTDALNAVCRFLAAPVPQGGSETPQTIPDKAEPCEGMPTFTIKDPLALNELTPGFVAGTSPPVAVEAIRLGYLVSSLSVTVNNRQATVILAPTQGGGWHLAAVREGDSDAAYAAKAGVGSLVFNEPQVRGWYELRLLTVKPLNDQAREALGGQSSVSLSDYQKLVKARYADKLPGSDYDTRGMSSGYGTAREPGDTTSSAPLLIGGSGTALALAGGAFLLFRRRRATTG
ncbi:LPXTG cell wall anchor domain-containing protein [Saccharothrix lopnurensis]|uniref:LPXTG cell wall anchor domain-containing protein n=1 Tax=Saccharothrix lopnurensis TaxID=1670621 RepID=A0ABW1PAH9_9PSEU